MVDPAQDKVELGHCLRWGQSPIDFSNEVADERGATVKLASNRHGDESSTTGAGQSLEPILIRSGGFRLRHRLRTPARSQRCGERAGRPNRPIQPAKVKGRLRRAGCGVAPSVPTQNRGHVRWTRPTHRKRATIAAQATPKAPASPPPALKACDRRGLRRLHQLLP